MLSDISAILSITKPSAVAFTLALPDASAFVCEEVVRVLPGRRLVCRGVWNNQSVFAKLFIGKSCSAYASRDSEGSNWLKAANILTPPLLYSAILHGRASLLIYQALMLAENAESYWRKQPQLHLTLAQALVKTLAQHHRAGLMQTDLHLKNFLVQAATPSEMQIYTLDGDGIRKFRSWCVKSQRLVNLATLFSKFDVLDDVWIPELYRLYCAEMVVPYVLHDELSVSKLTRRIRYQVSRTYADKKVFRTCSDVKVEKTAGQYRAVTSGFLMNQQAAELDVFLRDANANLKNGNTCTVGIAKLADRQVVIKRYNIKSIWHGMARALRPGRAAVSWANAHRLMIANIATPQPLALFEQRWGCLRGRAYFLSAYIDAPDVAQFYAQNSMADAQSTVAQRLATLFFKLYLLKYTHGDCKASNIKIVDLQPMLIDLDSMQAHTDCWVTDWIFERRHVKDLKRFMKNWQHNVTVTALFKQAIQSVYPDTAKHILIRAGLG